jgi:LAS superfamily LD-carboxypeptidase LdcB
MAVSDDLTNYLKKKERQRLAEQRKNQDKAQKDRRTLTPVEEENDGLGLDQGSLLDNEQEQTEDSWQQSMDQAKETRNLIVRSLSSGQNPSEVRSQGEDLSDLSYGENLNIGSIDTSVDVGDIDTSIETSELDTDLNSVEGFNPQQGGKATSGSSLAAKYGNGQIPEEHLKDIGNGHKLAPAAAAQFNKLRAAAKRDGVDITLTDSYRDLDTQKRLAQEKGLYKNGGLAAVPGTSNHGKGTAVDVDKGREWMKKNAKRFGFETIPREPWHFKYTGGGGSPRVGDGAKEQTAKEWLIDKESDGRVTADNPNSTAFGIGQLTIANRKKYGKQLGVDPNTTDKSAQLEMMDKYVEDRYGSYQKAKQFWEKKGWY